MTIDNLPLNQLGGTITFSPDVNCPRRNWFRTLLQRFFVRAMVARCVRESGLGGFTLSAPAFGGYMADGGSFFYERSHTVSILYADSTALRRLATAIRIRFQQESVLIEYRNASVAFVKD